MIISSDNGRRVFVLQVAGLRYRYMSHDLDLSSSNLDANIATGIAYQNVTGLVSVGALSGSIDPAGGVASYQGVSITLASRGARGAVSDPHVVFGRCGARSQVIKAKLTQSVDYTDNPPTLINVDRDLRGLFTTPALVHIGAETFRVSSVTVNTLISGERAVGGSQRQAHTITMGGTSVPEVTLEITTFRGRRAKLYMAHQFPDGALSDFVEVVNGFIDNTPQVEEAGEVSFSLLPLAALVSTASAAVGLQSNLRQGFHYFGTVANQVEWAWNLEGQPRIVIIGSVTTVGSIATVTLLNAMPEMEDLFDPSLPKSDDNLPRSHPRFPSLYLNGSGGEIQPTAVLSPTQFQYDTTDVGLVSVGQDLTLNPYAEIKRVGFEDELVEWPSALNARLATLQLSNSTQGEDGSWGRWGLVEDQLVVRPLAAVQPYRLEWCWWSSRQQLMQALPDALYWADTPTEALTDSARLRYPIQVDDAAIADPRPGTPQRFYRRSPAVNGRTNSTSFQLGGVARAWYQLREPLILCENSLGLPSSPDGNDYDIEVKYYDRVAGETRRQWFIATHETTAIFSGSAIGTYIHLKGGSSILDNVSFGEWQGQERAVLFRSSRYYSKRPGVLLLNLLESAGGAQVNGTYDIYPIGLGVPSSEIDEASFLAYDGTTNFSLSGTISGDDGALNAIIEGILKMMGCALIMRRDASSGLSRLTLQPLGAESSRLLDQTIDEGDWHVSPPPRWSTYEDIVTQITYRFGWDEQQQKYLAERTFVNQEAVNRYGGEMKKVDIEVRGLTIEDIGDGAGDSFGFFLPPTARIFSLLSNPAREWAGSIGTGRSMTLDVGAYVSVTSSHLKGYGDDYGVTNAVGFVRSINQELMGEGCQLEMISMGLSPVTWNASALVTAVSSSTSVTISPAVFSDDDASFFKAGDVVDYLPDDNEDSAIVGLVIASVVGAVITFTTSHGISAPDGTIEPTTYTNASTTHRADAYLASNDAVPVLGSDSAQLYA
jgi:hypothetical protein